MNETSSVIFKKRHLQNIIYNISPSKYNTKSDYAAITPTTSMSTDTIEPLL